MSEEPKLDEREAIKLLVSWLSAGQTYMPRFTPGNWWENDLCAVTRSGFWTEFEVKMSRQDFLADKAKKQKKYVGHGFDRMMSIENKHSLLATTDRGPARFYFAVREGVATERDLPAWAGLLVFRWEAWGNGVGGRWSVVELRKAPRRHSRKDLQIVGEIHRAAWFRGIGKLL